MIAFNKYSVQAFSLFFCFLFSSLLLPAQQVVEQDYSKLPELPVWYEVEYPGINLEMISLPNFDVARGGKNALSFWVYGSETNPTWYLRSKGDTANMYTWTAPFISMVQGDFNGDGIIDYVSGSREVYKGIANGSPPQQPYIAKYDYTTHASGVPYIGDYDGDGKADVLTRQDVSPTKGRGLGVILLGNEDLTKMEEVELFHADDSTECILSVYITSEKKVRLVTMTDNPKIGIKKLVLWDLSFRGISGFKKALYKRLHQLPVYFERTFPWFPRVMSNRDNGEHTLKIGTYMYSLDGDTISYIGEQSYYTNFELEHSIRNAAKSGLLVYAAVQPADKNKRYGVFLEGDVRRDTIAFGRIPWFHYQDEKHNDGMSNTVSIGDVNGDGKGDIAVFYEGIRGAIDSIYNRIVLYLGSDAPVGVQEGEPQGGNLRLALSPQPITAERVLHVNISGRQQIARASLELYDIQGKRVVQLWQGNLTPQPQQIELSIEHYGLGAGFYNLRLSSGGKVIDKGILIGER